MRTPSLSVSIVDDELAAARELGREIAELVRERGSRTVLGLATGRSPIALYRELVRLHREEGLSFRGVRTFNLDEYVGLAPSDPRSFRAFIERHLARELDLGAADVHVPRAVGSAEELAAEALRYSAAIRSAGGIDLQVLGLGRNGHVAFNEPGSPRDSRMRVVELAEETRADAAREFGSLENVPRQGLTLGIADVLDARRLRILAFGEAKRAIVGRVLESPPDSMLPATFLRQHPDARVWLDRAAAGQSR